MNTSVYKQQGRTRKKQSFKIIEMTYTGGNKSVMVKSGVADCSNLIKIEATDNTLCCTIADFALSNKHCLESLLLPLTGYHHPKGAQIPQK